MYIRKKNLFSLQVLYYIYYKTIEEKIGSVLYKK